MIPTTPAIRDLLKTRTHLRRAGFPPDHVAIVTIQEMVREYRQRVGIPTYLSEMLGPLAVLPVSEVRFYDRDGREWHYKGSERLIDMLRVALPDKWPWVVSSQIGERYL